MKLIKQGCGKGKVCVVNEIVMGIALNDKAKGTCQTANDAKRNCKKDPGIMTVTYGGSFCMAPADRVKFTSSSSSQSIARFAGSDFESIKFPVSSARSKHFAKQSPVPSVIKIFPGHDQWLSTAAVKAGKRGQEQELQTRTF
ncbi:unnamed protein product [Vitrella brassicaformis CCMP3155]|uniref:Uncharacterized protein n=1 Tax=Vitrella brassicaformis (strain CCMP3155) TaxID=1169540 RepID=A0A0G4GBV9_VITBC|nr:unnamed protein product [Vitrella brassicaformis CCMP3155]|eukprot:CEM26631.1 unnamed protein product [Vitrella brassicaformis CCMP3155]